MFSHDLEVEPGSTRLLGAVDGFEKVTSGFEGISVFTEGFLPSWIEYKGTNYRPGMTLLLSHSEDGEPLFRTVKSIVTVNSNVRFIVKD